MRIYSWHANISLANHEFPAINGKRRFIILPKHTPGLYRDTEEPNIHYFTLFLQSPPSYYHYELLTPMFSFAFSFLRPSCFSLQWVSYFCTPSRLPNLTTLMISGEKYKLWSPLLCRSLPPSYSQIFSSTPHSRAPIKKNKQNHDSVYLIFNFLFIT